MAKKLGESANKDAKLPGKEQVESVRRLYDSAKREAAEARGGVGTIIQNAEKKHNIHPAAFKAAVKLHDMDPVKRSAWLAHFDHYRDALGLDAQAEMFPETAGVEDADDGAGEPDEWEENAPDAAPLAPEPDPVAENVTRLKRGIKPLAAEAEKVVAKAGRGRKAKDAETVEPDTYDDGRPRSPAADAIAGWH